MNRPAAVTHADFKPARLARFAEHGLRIPPTLVTNDAEQPRKFAAEHGHLVYRPSRGLPAGEDGHSGAIWAQRVNPDSFDVLAGTGSVAKRGLNYVDDGISAAAQSVGNTTKQVTDSLGGVAAGATSIVGSLFG